MSYTPLEMGGKVAVVIGGTSGIGRAIAHGFAKAGADVVASSRRVEQVEATAGEIEQCGRKTIRVTSDVSDRASLQRLLEESVAMFGKVDILVNSAGRTKRAPTLDFSEEDWNIILETNLTGTLRACQVFGRHMIERGYGRIINIASLSTFVSLHEVSAYSASKAAVASLTKSLAIEWAPYGVCVNAIALAEAGADVAVHGNSRKPDRTRELIEGAGRRTLAVQGDLADKATPQRLVGQTLDEFGRLDILVNNAGTIRRAPATSPVSAFEHVTAR